MFVTTGLKMPKIWLKIAMNNSHALLQSACMLNFLQSMCEVQSEDTSSHYMIGELVQEKQFWKLWSHVGFHTTEITSSEVKQINKEMILNSLRKKARSADIDIHRIRQGSESEVACISLHKQPAKQHMVLMGDVPA